MDEKTDHYIGFVDVLDLCTFVIETFSENWGKHPHLYNPKELDKQFKEPLHLVVSMFFFFSLFCFLDIDLFCLNNRRFTKRSIFSDIGKRIIAIFNYKFPNVRYS
jgi:hypothetical protein